MPAQKSGIDKHSVGTFAKKWFNCRDIIGVCITAKYNISAAKVCNKMMKFLFKYLGTFPRNNKERKQGIAMCFAINKVCDKNKMKKTYFNYFFLKKNKV